MDYKIEINADQLNEIRNNAMKCKMIVLDKMDKNLLLNPKYFSKKEKEKLLKEVKELLETNTTEEINKKFNEICFDELFKNYEQSSVYVDKRFPEQQKKLDDEEPAFLKLKEDIKTNKLIEQNI
jgi:hypothetical protein